LFLLEAGDEAKVEFRFVLGDRMDFLKFSKVGFDVDEVLVEVGFVVDYGFVGEVFFLEAFKEDVEKVLVDFVEGLFLGGSWLIAEVFGGVDVAVRGSLEVFPELAEAAGAAVDGGSRLVEAGEVVDVVGVAVGVLRSEFVEAAPIEEFVDV